MKTVMVALGLLFLNSCSGTAPVGGSTDEIEAAILTRFEEGRAAWNRGDLNGYLSCYWNSDNTRFASGSQILYGNKAISEAYHALFPSPKEMGQVELAHLEIDILSETNALVFGHLVHTVGENSRRGIFTVHLRKTEGKWFVVSDHFSAVD